MEHKPIPLTSVVPVDANNNAISAQMILIVDPVCIVVTNSANPIVVRSILA